MTLRLSYGNAVTGDQRFDRPELQERFMRTLEHSAGVKMFGLRRIGKSTLRLYAVEQLERRGRLVTAIDGQGLQSLSDLLARLFAAMPRGEGFMNRALGLLSQGPAQAALQAVAQGTGHEDATLSAYWQLVSAAIRQALEGDGPKPVLVIDEFTYLIGNLLKRERGQEDVDKLLAAMREWRGSGMTMLLTGSIGLTALARTHGITVEHLNDLQPFTIPELSEEEARRFVRDATQEPSRCRWTDAHTDEFLRQSQVLYPCFLVRGLLQVGIENPPDPPAFAEIFEEFVRPDLHADFYNQFDRRFRAYKKLEDDEQEKLILPALATIMRADEPVAQDALPCNGDFTRVDLSIALSMLLEDGFIQSRERIDSDRLWKPASSLASAWWRRSKLA